MNDGSGATLWIVSLAAVSLGLLQLDRLGFPPQDWLTTARAFWLFFGFAFVALALLRPASPRAGSGDSDLAILWADSVFRPLRATSSESNQPAIWPTPIFPRMRNASAASFRDTISQTGCS